MLNFDDGSISFVAVVRFDTKVLHGVLGHGDELHGSERELRGCVQRIENEDAQKFHTLLKTYHG